MKYILRKDVLDNVPEIEISEENYSAYKEAKKTLSNCLAIEEKYEILISNYLDFEKQILDITTTSMIRDHINYSDFFDVRLGLNIRLVNLLTSARLYVDHLHRHVRSCSPPLSEAKTFVKSLLGKEYDENPEYRFMEALRNYVQHYGIPVHLISSERRRTDEGLLEHSVELTAQKASLEQDGEFKKKVLNEIQDKIDLKISTRSYMESLSKVHQAVRDFIEESVQKARLKLEDAHNQYRAVFTGNQVSLSAFMLGDQGRLESVPLLLDWDDVRIKLQKRNQRLINLRKRFATGKAEKS